jgi:hypothetical protein
VLASTARTRDADPTACNTVPVRTIDVAESKPNCTEAAAQAQLGEPERAANGPPCADGGRLLRIGYLAPSRTPEAFRLIDAFRQGLRSSAWSKIGTRCSSCDQRMDTLPAEAALHERQLSGSPPRSKPVEWTSDRGIPMPSALAVLS